MNAYLTPKPRLTLVGAGPGDPDLITLKGIKALQQADVVLYDALSCDELLDYAPATAQKIYTGKRAGRHSYKQHEINNLIAVHAFEYGHVVRLKGGDPFVFGRGHEEITAARALGIETAVVPGISSAVAVPAMADIPVTRRYYSQSFWTITATTHEGTLSKDIAIAAQSTATVVVLMGLGKLSQIVEAFQESGKGKTPVAIIQEGTTESQKVATGIIDTIVSQSAQKHMKAPAIIVIGEVAALHHSADNYQMAEYEKQLITKSI